MKQSFLEVVAYYYKLWHEFEMELHYHSAMEIMYVIKGKCQIEIEDRMIDLRKGQYIWIQSNVKHRLIVHRENPCRMLNIEFLKKDKGQHFTSLDVLFEHSLTLRSLFHEHNRYFLLKDDESVYNTLRHLVLELDRQTDSNQLLIDNLLVQLLLWTDRNRMEFDQQSDSFYIKKVLTHIHENYDTALRVEDLASMSHLHPSYLHRLFKASLNMTINQYITKVRLDKAKMLLIHTEIPVTEISNYVGVNTSQYFSSLFKKDAGLSPSAYREHFRQI
ncbi:AraC family transcriptional regulator [Gracilibacillus oryzae]|uniref:AraC family transcriptional regulator n=1 Tax=Gracilibacillus oryzae TaxID=1672701 RepID=A0A7C8KP15_9BACI|nr:AraC family transcriptional regulator [Gracilibacillus oryzae]KAB8130111.1 AraC family transcriptional regulator [Gracilibacillus oryzae]